MAMIPFCAAFFAASAMAFASSNVEAIGFSQSTCFPAFARDGDFGVDIVRRADAYHVDLGIVDDVAPVRAAFFKAEAFFRVCRDFRDDVADCF